MAAMDAPVRTPVVSDPEDDFGSALQLRLAASLLGRRIERNGGGETAAKFWDDEAEFDHEYYVDPELWDPGSETVPEMDVITENINGGL